MKQIRITSKTLSISAVLLWGAAIGLLCVGMLWEYHILFPIGVLVLLLVKRYLDRAMAETLSCKMQILLGSSAFTAVLLGSLFFRRTAGIFGLSVLMLLLLLIEWKWSFWSERKKNRS